MAYDLNLSVSTLKRVMARLKTLGLVAHVRGGRGPGAKERLTLTVKVPDRIKWQMGEERKEVRAAARAESDTKQAESSKLTDTSVFDAF